MYLIDIDFDGETYIFYADMEFGPIPVLTPLVTRESYDYIHKQTA